ncbi:hypothetical protein Sru01_37190 [Sphaerisporangium rufum]|uniref:Prepilin type IV endopeptidase peptidase domain-containing protein n=1 Tax=Sphaerisporangium rufum TaxID=1381558 RepID=A0A919R300_9ACTN|nr:A24 family peptidase [Sphaerisporangium rufum]GII78737.1 hypothetical protein Sru01_37190 [Sphaerisporangium rufum]
MSIIVAGAALLGLVAGHYARALAAGFAPLPDDPAPLPPGQEPPDGRPRGTPAAGGPPGGPAVEGGDAPEDRVVTREEARELRRAYRAEARAAFRGALRARPDLTRLPVAELATAAACALVAWRLTAAPAGLDPDLDPDLAHGLARWALLIAWLYGAVAGCALTMIDWRTRRLPDAITLPSYPILAVPLALAGELPGALAGGLGLAAGYFVLWFARPDALGLGDVKLAGPAGMLTGALGVSAWVTGALAGQLFGALYAIALLVSRRGTRRSHFPLGPFIVLGALAGLLR